MLMEMGSQTDIVWAGHYKSVKCSASTVTSPSLVHDPQFDLGEEGHMWGRVRYGVLHEIKKEPQDKHEAQGVIRQRVILRVVVTSKKYDFVAAALNCMGAYGLPFEGRNTKKVRLEGLLAGSCLLLGIHVYMYVNE
jgi:hypothetical protein